MALPFTVTIKIARYRWWPGISEKELFLRFHRGAVSNIKLRSSFRFSNVLEAFEFGLNLDCSFVLVWRSYRWSYRNMIVFHLYVSRWRSQWGVSQDTSDVDLLHWDLLTPRALLVSCPRCINKSLILINLDSGLI